MSLPAWTSILNWILGHLVVSISMHNPDMQLVEREEKIYVPNDRPKAMKFILIYQTLYIFVSIESDENVQILFRNHEPDTNSIIKMQFNAKIYIIRSWWMDIFVVCNFQSPD